MKPGNTVLSGFGTTVFARVSALAAEYGAINLGQGFPDEDGAPAVVEAAAEAMKAGGTANQYPPLMGLPELCRAVATHDARFYGLDFDPDREVLITSGATEALASALLGLIEPGDEVVLIEPLYDSYLPIVLRGGGVPKLVRLESPSWELPRDALEAAFSERTKLIVLNSPQNPAGKVFDADELAFVASLLERFDAYAICDEVYEHLVFDRARHIPLMTLPGMRDRCLRIGSAGKIFSVTGWKIGWVVGSAELMRPVVKAHQFLTFTVPPNLQKGVAFGLGLEDAFFHALASDMQGKRDRLAAGLSGIGFDVLDSAGTYFLTVDFRPLGFDGDDEDFCRHITVEAGVTAVPVSAFYQEADVDHFARFCFCKRDEVLDEAVDRLAGHFGG